MNKYQKAKIYKLTSTETDQVYVGSTCEKLNRRFSLHKGNYKKWLQQKHNHSSFFELFKYSDCKIELIENYSCESRQELLAKEQYWIDNMSNCINKNKASTGMTREEYMKNKCAKRLATKIMCECGGKTNLNHKARHEKTNKHQVHILLKDFTENKIYK